MKNVSQDIYGTDRKERGKTILTENNRANIYTKPYLDAMRRRQRSTIVLAVIVIICILIISALIVRYDLQLTKKNTGRWSVKSSTFDKYKTFDVQMDSQTQFLMDELTEKKITSIPDGGDMPLTAPWVKQAAYYIIQAEKDERDERFDDALENYHKAKVIFPDLKGIHRKIGLIYLRRKEYENAEKAFEKVKLEEDLTFGLANNLGVSYLSMEQYDKAEKNFLLAIKLNPQYPLAYFNLATLYLRTKELEKSADFFQRYLALKADDISAAQTYAMILIELEQWDRAITLLKAITRAAPDVAPLYFRLAEALSHTSDHAGAVEALRRGAALMDPRKALAWMSRPEFDELRNDSAFQNLLTELGSAD